ncbi:hypothetical protein A2U01_0023348, partial [Trifolium medium]|nr:hypothetical protein [Trifolium medium]
NMKWNPNGRGKCMLDIFIPEHCLHYLIDRWQSREYLVLNCSAAKTIPDDATCINTCSAANICSELSSLWNQMLLDQ